jgi:hypothetical protein
VAALALVAVMGCSRDPADDIPSAIPSTSTSVPTTASVLPAASPSTTAGGVATTAEESPSPPGCRWADLGVEFSGDWGQPWGDLVMVNRGGATCVVDLTGAQFTVGAEGLTEQSVPVELFRAVLGPGNIAVLGLSWDGGPCGESPSESQWRLVVAGSIRSQGALACPPASPIRRGRTAWFIGSTAGLEGTCSFRDMLMVVGDETPESALERYLDSTEDAWAAGLRAADGFVRRLVTADEVWFGLADESPGVARLLVDHRDGVGWSVHQVTFCPR